MDDDFSNEKIIIVLTKEETNKFREYSIADFAEIDCVSIIDLTGSIYDAVKYNNTKNTLIDIDNFNRILCLELEDKTKENVLESIKKLEHRNDILSAEPDVTF